MMSRRAALLVIVVILLAGFYLRVHRLLDYPLYTDEVINGEIVQDMVGGNLSLWHEWGTGREPMFNLAEVPAVLMLGDNALALRWPAVLFGVLLIPLLYVWAVWLLGSRLAGLTAAALACALWWPLVFSRLAIRTITLPVCITLALMGLWRGLYGPPGRARRCAALGGVAAGLTQYTFTAALGFPAVVAAFLAYLWLTDRPVLRARWRGIVAYIVIAIAVAGPFLFYLYASPDLTWRIGMVNQPLQSAQAGDLVPLLNGTLKTLGMFWGPGDHVWFYNLPGRPVFEPPALLLFLAGALICAWQAIRGHGRRGAAETLLLLLGLIMLAPSAATDAPPSTHRAIGALPAVLVLPTVPLAALARTSPSRRTLVALVAVGVVALTGLAVAGDMFGVWIGHPDQAWMAYSWYVEMAHFVDRTTDDAAAFNFNNTSYDYLEWRQLERQILRADAALRRIFGSDALVFPAEPETLYYGHQVDAAPLDPLRHAFLGEPVYRSASVDSRDKPVLTVYRARRADAQTRAEALAAVYAPDGTPLERPVVFGGYLELLGVETIPAADDQIALLSYWHVAARPPFVSIFVHALGPDGALVAQHDGLGAAEFDLEAGDLIVQLHTLPLPAERPASAAYDLTLGVYTQADMVRLPVAGGVDDHVRLGRWPEENR